MGGDETPTLRLKNGTVIEDLRGKGDEYCHECGFIAPREKFVDENKCPNSECPFPWGWNTE